MPRLIGLVDLIVVLVVLYFAVQLILWGKKKFMEQDKNGGSK